MKNPEIGEIWTMKSSCAKDDAKKLTVRITEVSSENDCWRVQVNPFSTAGDEKETPAFYGRGWFLEFLPSSTLVEQTPSPIMA